ncbi:uncharacterized protein [Mytilus edulis]|uniref:uncharacterized protein isoform X2 n=1 Tax=Mytilus edulis TaxID=6550 RepID=UPI0039F01D27
MKVLPSGRSRPIYEVRDFRQSLENAVKAKMGDENVCSVCWDTFKFPKMLPCKHSFCISCLHEFLGGLKDKSNLICPLCREPCYVPDKGFTDFPTNYFVPVEKTPKLCEECQELPVYKNCYLCSTIICKKCDRLHIHDKKSDNPGDDDSEKDSLATLPPHLHWSLMHQNMKTEILCQQISMFVGEFLPIDDIRKSVRSIAVSRTGGAYVKLNENEFLVKYDKHGKIVNRILLHGDAATVLETMDGLLFISHFSLKAVVCYGDNPPDSKKYYFVKTPTFHPIGMTELQNGNIAVSGPTHLCTAKCKNNDCELSKTSPGVLNIYNRQGALVKEIKQDIMEPIFNFPTEIASNDRTKTIAVCDTHLNKVIILDYDGKVRGFFKGWKLPFTLFSENFLPLSVCSTADGYFLVVDPHKECLHILNPYGKFIGIVRGEDGDSLADSSAVCVDTENNIWVGHHNQGTITVLKPSCFKNKFDQMRFPFLGGEDLRLPFFPGLNLDSN